MEGATEQELLMWMDVVRTAASPGPRLGRRLFSVARANVRAKCGSCLGVLCDHAQGRLRLSQRKLRILAMSNLLGLDIRFIDVSDDFQSVKLGDGQVDA